VFLIRLRLLLSILHLQQGLLHLELGLQENLEMHQKTLLTDNQLANLTGSLKSFKDEVKNNQVTGAKGLFRGSDTARMTAKYQSLLMGVKDLYTLGALTGPDLGIIESQLTNPASWSGKMTSQKGFEEQIQVLEDMLKRNVINLENSYGRQPKASKKALESLGGGGGEWSVVK
jgi:hypothetical protein